MIDNAQPTGGDDRERVEMYKRLVLEYEALDEEIDGLLSLHGGATEKMSDEEFERYRGLAHRRDHIYNQMKLVERQILLDDDSESEA